ncbi:MAG: DMT family transporter [Chloroflexota bacterium]
MGDSAELLALAAALIGALAQIVTKGSIGAVPPWIYLPLRWFTSAGILVVVATVLNLWPAFRWDETIVYPLAAAVLGPLISWNLYTRAMGRLDLSVAYSITQSSVLITIVIATFWLGESPSVFTVIGAVIVLAGVWLVQGRVGLAPGKTVSLLGVALAGGTAICWGLNGPLWKLSVMAMSEIQVNLVRTGLASVVFGVSLGVIALTSHAGRSTMQIALTTGRRGLLSAALAGLLADVGAFWFQFSALKVGDVSTVTPILSSSPLFVALLSAGLLGERLRRAQIAGVVLIVIGVLIVGFAGRG